MGLNFSDRHDISRWRERCAEQRKIAEEYPAFDKRMVTVEEYQWNLGPWRIIFCLEIWSAPRWNASVSIQEEVAHETVELGNGQKAEIPQDAMLMLSSWSPEHFEQAKFILGEVFGPILRPGDDHQKALEFHGLNALHWIVPYEGERPWIRKQA